MTRPSLAAAVRSLLPHILGCRACGAPATRTVHGRLRLASGDSTAQVDLCDTCPAPVGGPLARYTWGMAIDLPHAAALRAVLAALNDGG